MSSWLRALKISIFKSFLKNCTCSPANDRAVLPTIHHTIMHFSVGVCALTLALALATATSAYNVGERQYRKLLVVVDDTELETSHSKLFDFLKAGNFELNIQNAADGELDLMKDGEYIYDGVALLCPNAPDMASKLPVKQLTKLLDSGRDVLITANWRFSDYTASVAKMIGVDLVGDGVTVIDHVNHVGAKHPGWIYAGGYVPSKRLFGDKHDAKIAFRGPAASLFKDNELVDNVVWGAGSSYAAETGNVPLRSPLRAVGSQNVFGAALSTRAQSRGVYWGSLEALSDDAEEKFGSGHADALRHFAAWTFGHAGVLKVMATRHMRVEADGEDRAYRVKDLLRYEMDVLEWSGQRSRFVPFVDDDVQLEFTMLNPWVRTRFSAQNNTLSAQVQVPDQIGVYKFVVNHHRPGYTPITFQEIVPARPFLHNEYDRFLRQALPYYVTTFNMIVGVLLLGIVLLYSKDSKSNEKGTTSTTQNAAAVVEAAREGMRRRRGKQS